MRKFQRVEGPLAQDSFVEEKPTEEIEEEKLDVNCLDVVLERVAAGLIGTLRIEDDMNKPLLRKVFDTAINSLVDSGLIKEIKTKRFYDLIIHYYDTDFKIGVEVSDNER